LASAVFFGSQPAQGVVVLNDTTITCDAPAGLPGPVDVIVQGPSGSGTLASGFTYTPAARIEPEAAPGGAQATLTFLQDEGDWLFAIFGLPPVLSIPTPPFAGALSIWPLNTLFAVQSWPFDTLSQVLTVPSDPALSGVQVLFQALIGPEPLGGDAAWTDCAVFTIL
jgi:hypothetical protein